MLRLGLIGDTQGRYRVPELLEAVRRYFAGVDEIWHAGDWQYEEVLDGLREIAPLTVVNGNAPDDRRFPEHVVRTLEGLDLGMTHRPPRGDEPWLKGLDICIHGHTHRWRDEVREGVRFLNVSTPTAAFPSSDRSMGILTLDAGNAALLKIELG
jgi:uncharacterized protein